MEPAPAAIANENGASVAPAPFSPTSSGHDDAEAGAGPAPEDVTLTQTLGNKLEFPDTQKKNTWETLPSVHWMFQPDGLCPMPRVRLQRGYLKRNPRASNDEADEAIKREQLAIQKESAARRELGLFRNASLTLGALAGVKDQHAEALDHLLDVAFLDLNGANNVPPTYDRRFADLLPMIAGMIHAEIEAAEVSSATVQENFAAKWKRFAAFGQPPFTFDHCWSKLRKALKL